MELASMFSGDQFTDTPRSVCPVLRSFMRGYNDQLRDAMRQDLYAVASQPVNTHDSVDVTAWRLHACIGWADSLHVPGRLAQVRSFFCPRSLRDCELAGRLAGELARTDPSQHAKTLAFPRSLIAHRSPPTPSSRHGQHPPSTFVYA